MRSTRTPSHSKYSLSSFTSATAFGSSTGIPESSWNLALPMLLRWCFKLKCFLSEEPVRNVLLHKRHFTVNGMTTGKSLQLCASMKYKTMNADATCSIAFLTSANFKCNNWETIEKTIAGLEMERTKAWLFVPKVRVFNNNSLLFKMNRLESRVRVEEGCSRVRMK